MKYTCTVEIALNREECIKLWFDESQFKKWQDGFKYKKWTKGEPNEENSISHILIVQGKNKIELEEQIIENRLPDYILGNYIHKHMINTQKVIFHELSANQTNIQTDVVYTKFIGIMPKLMAFLFPGMFRKQSQKWLNEFKTLAEKSN